MRQGCKTYIPYFKPCILPACHCKRCMIASVRQGCIPYIPCSSPTSTPVVAGRAHSGGAAGAAPAAGACGARGGGAARGRGRRARAPGRARAPALHGAGRRRRRRRARRRVAAPHLRQVAPLVGEAGTWCKPGRRSAWAARRQSVHHAKDRASRVGLGSVVCGALSEKTSGRVSDALHLTVE